MRASWLCELKREVNRILGRGKGKRRLKRRNRKGGRVKKIGRGRGDGCREIGGGKRRADRVIKKGFGSPMDLIDTAPEPTLVITSAKFAFLPGLPPL